MSSDEEVDWADVLHDIDEQIAEGSLSWAIDQLEELVCLIEEKKQALEDDLRAKNVPKKSRGRGW